MSQASYLDFSGLAQNDLRIFEDKLKGTSLNAGKIFATEQVATFTGSATPSNPTDGFSFVSTHPNDPTGFSATVFKCNADNSYTIAVRGTEPSGLQILADLVWADGVGVVLAGKAFDQLVQAFRYYKQITTIAGNDVQYTAAELDMLGRAEAGALLGPGRGFLSSFLPGEITTAIGQVTALVANDKGLGKLIPDGAVINFTADGDFVHTLGNVDPGYAISIAQEDFGVSGAVSSNHSSVNGVDGLNLIALIAKLDPSLINSPMQISDFIRKASNDYKNTYEKTLDALRHMILGGDVADTPTSTGSSDPNRTAFYANMDVLQNSSVFQSLIGQVTITAAPSSGSEARTDFSAFLSLFYLTPFTLKTNNAAANNLLLAANSALGDKWTDDYNLNSEDLQNGKANFSDMYLADRAAMLGWVLKSNLADTAGRADGLNATYIDKTSGINLGPILNPNSIQQFVFGDGSAETIAGSGMNDHLYGGAGSNTLSGSDGNDYIEGGADNDTLNGDAGNDTLIGGAGNDTLTAGEGNDQLKGGEGLDVYQFSGTYGTDVITDSDGRGSITVDGTPIAGGKKVAEGIYRNESTKYTYTLGGSGDTQSLFIQKDGNANKIIIRNWTTAESLSITLDDAQAVAPQATLTGDFSKYKLAVNDARYLIQQVRNA